MVFTIYPQGAFAEGEDSSNKALQLGTGSITCYSAADGHDYIYFGEWENSPVKWRVLDDQTNTGNNGLFLLSDELIVTHNGGNIGGVEFDDTSNEWQGSNAQSWCKDFATASFTDTELSSVIKTIKDDEEYTTMGNQEYTSVARTQILNGDQIFFLSLQEATNPDYGFSDDSSRIAYFDEINSFHWYIRSKVDSNITILLVEDDGEIQQYVFNISGDAGKHILPVRPAFNMDTSNVLFTSAAEKGKITGIGETLSSVADYTGSEWKLTLLDNTRSSFTVDDGEAKTSAEVGYSNWSIPITYSGAQTGENEYVSVLLCRNRR